MMIDIIVLLIIFNDVQFSILIISIIFLRARAPDSRLITLRRIAFTFGSSVLKPDFNLSFGEIQGFCKLLTLLPNNILILFKSMFKLQQLSRREGGANSFWFSEGKKEFWELWT